MQDLVQDFNDLTREDKPYVILSQTFQNMERLKCRVNSTLVD